MQFLTTTFFEFLLFLYQTTGSLGVAIIVMTLIIRFSLIPLTLPSLKAREKMKQVQPELSKLKKKHGKNKQAFQKAQLKLYQKYNVNPLSGCLPQLVQIGVLIFLYKALINFLSQSEVNGVMVNAQFLWLNLAKPDYKYVLPVLAGLFQLMLSLMIAPGGEVRDVVSNKSQNKKVKAANKKEEDVAGMAASMQQQMIFIMPIMTGFIALRFPSGLTLYWVITTLFSIIQQYFVSGWGGWQTYFLRAQDLLKKEK